MLNTQNFNLINKNIQELQQKHLLLYGLSLHVQYILYMLTYMSFYTSHQIHTNFPCHGGQQIYCLPEFWNILCILATQYYHSIITTIIYDHTVISYWLQCTSTLQLFVKCIHLDKYFYHTFIPLKKCHHNTTDISAPKVPAQFNAFRCMRHCCLL